MWPQMYMSDSIWNEEHWLEEADKGKRLCYTRTGNATLLSKSADRTLLVWKPVSVADCKGLL